MCYCVYVVLRVFEVNCDWLFLDVWDDFVVAYAGEYVGASVMFDLCMGVVVLLLSNYVFDVFKEYGVDVMEW